MNALVKKEIRLLLPAWIVAMLLAIVPIPIPIPIWTGWLIGAPHMGVPLTFALGFLLLGLASFGQEISSGSFSTLLAQPMERRRIWEVKTKVLASGFVSVLFVWTVPRELYFILRLQENLWFDFPFELANRLILFALTIFSGALWTTLLLRQIVPAFALTLLVPMTLMFWVGMLSDHYNWPGTVGAGVLIAYSIAGFFWARSLFLRAQDIQWTGGNIFFPWRGIITQSKIASISSGPRHWLSALVWKEIQLHQANLLIAAIVMLLNFSSLAVLKFHPHFKDPDMQLILESMWLLWLLLPLLIGSAAIAEERRFGVLEPQLCLPVSRRAQLFIKFFTALILSLFLGGLIPFFFSVRMGDSVRILGNEATVLATLTAVIFFISFYASSLARTALQAIGLTMLLAVLIQFYQGAVGIVPWGWGSFYNASFGLLLLKRYIVAFILLLVLGALIPWNFKQLHQNWKLWACNIAALLAALIFSSFLADGIYFRDWELVMSLEPRGPIRITSSGQVKFMGNQDELCAILPDGRLWFDKLAYSRQTDANRASILLAPGRNRPEFIGSSNWVGLAVGDVQAIGIKSDGTLWNIQSPRQSFSSTGNLQTTQIGSDNDWSQVANDPRGFLMLKRDGTLWALVLYPYGGVYSGVYDGIRANRNLKKLKPGSHPLAPANSAAKSTGRNIRRSFPLLPVQISDESGWNSLYSTRSFAYARKNDGSSWVWKGMTGTSHTSVFVQETNMDNQWLSLDFSDNFAQIVVKTNGDMWYYASESRPPHEAFPSMAYPRTQQLGRGMKWKEAIFSQLGIQTIMAIRNDNTLWAIPLGWNSDGRFTQMPIQLGNHADWVAVTSGFTLASDGSLWAWHSLGERIGFRGDHQELLAPSRGPISMGNIFQATEATP